MSESYMNIAGFDITIINNELNKNKIIEEINSLWENFIISETKFDLKKYFSKSISYENTNHDFIEIGCYLSLVEDIEDYENKNDVNEIAALLKKLGKEIENTLKNNHSEIISGRIISFDENW